MGQFSRLRVELARFIFRKAGLMTVVELSRRLISLIYAGRNRKVMIRRELPRTRGAGWTQRSYRIEHRRILLFVCPSTVISAALRLVALNGFLSPPAGGGLWFVDSPDGLLRRNWAPLVFPPEPPVAFQ